jgi:hypothetical protein
MRRTVLLGLACVILILLPVGLSAQELEGDPSIPRPWEAPEMIYPRDTKRPEKISVPRMSDNDRPILSGTITLQTALQMEQERIDWYTWYLDARRYLATHDGIRCETGTTLLFRKDGRMTALTDEPACLATVANKRFPLPLATNVEAVIFPHIPMRTAPVDADALLQFLAQPLPQTQIPAGMPMPSVIREAP